MTFLDIIAIALSIFGALCIIILVYAQATELVKWKRRALEAEYEVRILRHDNTALENRRRVITFEHEKDIA